MSTMRAAVRRGFTLIELLVVVAIIALLIAILLPSLGKARGIAKTAVCGTNLKAIGTAMAAYASEWNNAILGNARTSSSRLWNSALTGAAPASGGNPAITEAGNIPELISTNDWMTPTARVMGLNFNAGGTQSDRIERFTKLTSFKSFICPENDIVATAYTGDGGPNFPVHRMISYNTAMCFQYMSKTGVAPTQTMFDSSWVNINFYEPRVQKVGNPGRKVFIADGGRFMNSGAASVTTNGAAISGTSPGGMCSDWGPWNRNNRAYNKAAGGDGRTVSMRHGNRKANAGLSSFRFNLGFFDGHVEALNGLEGADPNLWIPTGATVNTGTEFLTDSDFTGQYGNYNTIK